MSPDPLSFSECVLPAVSQARGEIRLPGSKSISNRALLLAALADGETRLEALLNADDVRYMREALLQLGVVIDFQGEENWRVYGCGGRFPNSSADLFLGNAGTAVRPLTAALAILGGNYTVRGVPRMHERPIADLVDALRALHCKVTYQAQEGYPPLSIAPRVDTDFPATVAIRGDVSSQFLSALLMALPLIGENGIGNGARHTEVRITTPLISRPYVAITTHLMARFGIHVETPDPQRFLVPRGVHYQSPGTLAVESDASSASYFLAAGVLGGGPVRVLGVGRDSIQGDVAFAEVLRAQGATVRYGDDFIEAQRGAPLRGGTIDCLAIPDAAMTLAITALIAQTPTTLINIGSWRVKETDRIHAMATELAKLGAAVDSGHDWLKISPAPALRHAAIDTYDDHRMAMCFSLVSLLGTAVTIRDPGCVAKTFPGYFEALRGLLA